MNRVKVGDLFNVVNNVYVQFLGVHPLMGECVAIGSLSELRSGLSRAILFYPLKRCIASKQIAFVENQKTVSEVPLSIRRPKLIKDKVVQSWFIDDSNGTHEIKLLSSSEMELPVGVVVSHDVLMEWLEGNWSFLLGGWSKTMLAPE